MDMKIILLQLSSTTIYYENTYEFDRMCDQVYHNIIYSF